MTRDTVSSLFDSRHHAAIGRLIGSITTSYTEHGDVAVPKAELVGALSRLFATDNLLAFHRSAFVYQCFPSAIRLSSRALVKLLQQLDELADCEDKDFHGLDGL
jgi:hypothetical protein